MLDEIADLLKKCVTSYFCDIFSNIESVLCFKGRRIIYDYKKFGDTPTCISSGKDIIGKAAISQGYGFTEKGMKGFTLNAFHYKNIIYLFIFVSMLGQT